MAGRDREKNRVYLARRRAERKAEGRCVECGQPVQDGRSVCVQCSGRSSRRRAERKAKRRCVECGQPAQDGRSVCVQCDSRQTLRRASLRKRRRESGLCPRCGAVPDTGKSWCVTCAILRPRNPRARPAELEKLRQRSMEAIAGGRCRACMRNPAVPGRGGKCDRCADKRNARCRELRAAKREALVKETPF